MRPTLVEWQLPRVAKSVDRGLLAAMIARNLDDREFFTRAAIGWALRECARRPGTRLWCMGLRHLPNATVVAVAGTRTLGA
ncbi:hypothetical protein BH10ACT5_BH10ACT5_01260 [soil metagenome]